MDERSGSVRLVDAPPRPETRQLFATVRRADVAEALHEEGPVDLLLDVDRVTEAGGRETERLTLAWEPQDLERLLATTGGDDVQLTFDESELQRFLDEDVEGHGMREKLAVLTVVAGMAAAGAGAAAGAIPRDEGGASAGAPVAAVTTSAPASEISTGLGTPAAQSAEAGRSATASEVSTGLVGQAPAAPSEISTGIVQEPPVTPAEVTTGIVQAPTATPVSDSPSGWSVSPDEVALAAGTILALAAVGFAARSRHQRPATS